MATVFCDDCHVAIGETVSVIYLDPEMMNKHSDEVHGGKEFGYSAWKD